MVNGNVAVSFRCLWSYKLCQMGRSLPVFDCIPLFLERVMMNVLIFLILYRIRTQAFDGS
jgi:hypothetical protein